MSAQTNSSQKNKGEQVNKKISENLFSSSLIDDGFLMRDSGYEIRDSKYSV